MYIHAPYRKNANLLLPTKILQESDAGTTMYFACNIGIHCTGGGMGFSVTVNPIDTPAPTPAPVGNTITIDPWTFDNYEDLTAKVGDEIVFVWEKYVEHALHSLK